MSAIIFHSLTANTTRRSLDGGITWSANYNSGLPDSTQYYFNASDSLGNIIIAQPHTIYISSNDGASFSVQTSFLQNVTHSIYGNNQWLVSGNNITRYTGSPPTQDSDYTKPANLTAYAFSSNTFWACAYSTTNVYSSSNGSTWSVVGTLGVTQSRAITATSTLLGVISYEDATISCSIMRQSDGVVLSTLGAKSTLYSIANNGTDIAAAEYGTANIHLYTSSSNTWSIQAAPYSGDWVIHSTSNNFFYLLNETNGDTYYSSTGTSWTFIVNIGEGGRISSRNFAIGIGGSFTLPIISSSLLYTSNSLSLLKNSILGVNQSNYLLDLKDLQKSQTYQLNLDSISFSENLSNILFDSANHLNLFVDTLSNELSLNSITTNRSLVLSLSPLITTASLTDIQLTTSRHLVIVSRSYSLLLNALDLTQVTPPSQFVSNYSSTFGNTNLQYNRIFNLENLILSSNLKTILPNFGYNSSVEVRIILT